MTNIFKQTTTTGLQTFAFDAQDIRVIMQDDEAWFVGKDVAEILGYAKPSNALATHVDAEDKTTAPIQGNGTTQVYDSILINESGVYELIFSSKLPAAKRFKRWVMEVVLPSIRKTGSYNAPKPMTQLEMIAQTAQVMVEQERKLLLIEQQQQEQSNIVNTVQDQVAVLMDHSAKLTKLNTGYITITQAHTMHGSFIQSSAKWKDLCKHIGVKQLKPYVYRNEAGIVCNSYQLKPSDAAKIAQDIAINMFKRSKVIYAYPGFPSGFKVV